MSFWGRSRFAVVTLSLQLLFLFLFGLFSRYQYRDVERVETRWFYPSEYYYQHDGKIAAFHYGEHEWSVLQITAMNE